MNNKNASEKVLILKFLLFFLILTKYLHFFFFTHPLLLKKGIFSHSNFTFYSQRNISSDDKYSAILFGMQFPLEIMFFPSSSTATETFDKKRR